MFRLIFLIGVFIASLHLTGCGTMYLDTPADKTVKLLSKNAPVSVRIEKTIWFKWWGSEPIDSPHTAEIIKENNLKEVRLYMTNTFVDGLVSIFTGVVGFPRRTLIVEGNK